MSVDRFIKWGKPRDHGPPTLEKLMAVAQEFLGSRWKVYLVEGTRTPCSIVCETDEQQTYPLISEYVPCQNHDGPPTQEEIDLFRSKALAGTTRGFEIYFPGPYGKTKERSSIITRQADEFTDALASQYAKIIARYWNGKIEWPS